jgi:NitT/TauT family transport system substrate-binding protein
MKTFIVAALLGLASLTPGFAQEKVKLRIGHLPVTGHAKFFIAQEEGFFAAEGLDIELVEFANSADGFSALRGGKLDLGAFGTTAPLLHVSKGADIRIIGGIMGEDASLFATPETAASIKSIADLKGKKIATVRLATGDAVLRGALEQAGLNWKTDVQIFELKNPPAVQEAVKSGQVDVGVTWGPFDLRAEQAGLKIVIRSRALSPGHPCCRLSVNTKDANERPEVFVHVLKALLRAEKFAQDNHEKTIDDIVKYLKLDRTLIKTAYYEGFLDQSTDPNLRGVVQFWQTMLKSEFITSSLDIKNFVETSFYKQALDQLSQAEPKEEFWKARQKVFASRDTEASLAAAAGNEFPTSAAVLAANATTKSCH